MKITSAEFVSSYADVSKCPTDGKPEFAFIGRSNVGKSSLINMLTNSRHLAKTSSTPGKTQTINHFAIWVTRSIGKGFSAMSAGRHFLNRSQAAVGRMSIACITRRNFTAPTARLASS